MTHRIFRLVSSLFLALVLSLSGFTPSFSNGVFDAEAAQVQVPAIQSFTWVGQSSASLNQTIGFKFAVLNEAVTITALGFYDQNGDGLTTAHQVGLWTDSGQLLESITIPSGTVATLIIPAGTPGGGYRYSNLSAPRVLDPNTNYVIGSLHSLTDPIVNGVSNLLMNPAIGYVDSRLSFNNSGFTFPSLFGSSDQHFANLGTSFLLQSTLATQEVNIDIKPGRFPNRIKLTQNVCNDDDNLYVAILTTPAFNARTVNVSTLQLGDPNLSGKETPIKSRITNVDGDGDKDIVLTFTLCGIVTNGALTINSTEMVLTGMTLDGVSITGRDSVKVVR